MNPGKRPPPPKPARPIRSGKSWGLLVAVVVVLFALGAVGFVILNKSRATREAVLTAQNTSNAPAQPNPLFDDVRPQNSPATETAIDVDKLPDDVAELENFAVSLMAEGKLEDAIKVF